MRFNFSRILSWVRQHWLVVTICLVVVSFLFNQGFRLTLSRKQAIKKAQAEYEILQQQNAEISEKIRNLEKHPQSYESLVRRELGYLRPGEKEVRLLKEKNPS